MNRAVVSLGANIAPEENIARAQRSLGDVFSLILASSFVWTKPIGPIAQDDFLNGVVLIETDLDQTALKAKLKSMEVSLGRRLGLEKWGPREIDLDVIIFNGEVVDKDYYERDFLQKAVKEILPQLKLRCC